MYKTIKYLGATSLLMLSMGAQAAVIDMFSTPQGQLVDDTPGNGGLSSSVGDGTDATILGGSRDIFVELLERLVVGGVSNPTGVASIGVAGGALSFSTDSLVTGTGIVQWDGPDNDINLDVVGLRAGGATGVDITDGGTANAFAVTTIFSDLGYEFVIGAYTDADNWTVISFSATAVNTPTTTYIPFSGFTNAALCGALNPAPGVNSITCGGAGFSVVDFANLGALELLIDPTGSTTSVDLTIAQVVTVPEPSVLGLLGAALLAGGFVSARKRKTA